MIEKIAFVSPYIVTLTHKNYMNMETEKEKIKVESTVKVKIDHATEDENTFDKVTPKAVGMLDMIIAFDTTGSMAAYIDDVRMQVADMVPRLFKDNENLRLGIVAFGDYCDMDNAQEFGNAFQCMPLTNNENDIIRFVRESKDTNGGDGDEFYELVIRKIVEESPWREGSTKVILLIADAEPHKVGYTLEGIVTDSRIDWRDEARKAASKKIKIDTVSICGASWYEKLSAMTNGICVPFKSSGKTATMIETATTARAVMDCAVTRGKLKDAPMSAMESKLRSRLFTMFADCKDEEMNEIYASYKKEIDDVSPDSEV